MSPEMFGDLAYGAVEAINARRQALIDVASRAVEADVASRPPGALATLLSRQRRQHLGYTQIQHAQPDAQEGVE